MFNDTIKIVSVDSSTFAPANFYTHASHISIHVVETGIDVRSCGIIVYRGRGYRCLADVKYQVGMMLGMW